LCDLIIIPSISFENYLNRQFEEITDIIEIDPKEVQSFNFNINKNDRLEMFSNGYETARQFIEKKKILS
jgi:hypothetical protein